MADSFSLPAGCLVAFSEGYSKASRASFLSVVFSFNVRRREGRAFGGELRKVFGSLRLCGLLVSVSVSVDEFSPERPSLQVIQ